MKILHTADIHFGYTNYGRIDPATGLNTRLADFRRCFQFMVQHGLKEDIDVFLFCGDAFRTESPNPTVQKAFADCLRPLVDASVPIVMITGNHDHPVSFGKASSIDIFGYLRGETYVYRRPTSARIRTRRGVLQLLAMPWPVRSLLLFGKDFAKVNAPRLSVAIAEKYTEIIARYAQALDPDLPAVLAGHFAVSGSKMGGSESHSLALDEPTFTPAQLSVRPIDYVALGHIHHFQNMAPDAGATPVVYSSSIERVTFNEEHSRKGFVLVEITGRPKRTTFSFVETPARRFLTIDVDARQATDPTATIVQAILRRNLKGAIVRVRYRIGEEQAPHIDQAAIEGHLQAASRIASIERRTEPRERLRRTRVTSDLSIQHALAGYIDQHAHLRPVKDALLARARDLEAEASLPDVS